MKSLIVCFVTPDMTGGPLTPEEWFDSHRLQAPGAFQASHKAQLMRTANARPGHRWDKYSMVFKWLVRDDCDLGLVMQSFEEPLRKKFTAPAEVQISIAMCDE